jgi:S-adenosylmethionine decarboxylase
MRGLHCTADLSGCNLDKLLAHAALNQFALERVTACGLQAVAQQSHVFSAVSPVLSNNNNNNNNNNSNSNNTADNGGITLTILLAESHLCIHTWPELLGVTLDVYVCNFASDNSNKARQLMAQLIAWFEPSQIQQNELERGV